MASRSATASVDARLSFAADLVDAADTPRFGGKAAALAQALRAGLPVPPGFALAWDAAVADKDLGRFADLLAGPVAVRSSAVDEDSAQASFAGQHGTKLGVVGRAALHDAIAAVRASGAAGHALDYRQRMNLQAQARVGVVVQRMIAAEIAGVLFTRNPLSGAHEILIEAVSGLGEMLVCGRATPVQYRLDAEGGLLASTPGHQPQALLLDADGRARECARTQAELDARLLSPAQLRALFELGRRCEQVFGSAQDLEWAWAGGRLYLLQSRPITALAETGEAARVALHADPGRGILWSRVNVGEAIPGTVRPLTADFHRDSIEVSPQYMFQRMGVLPRGPIHRPGTADAAPARFLCGRMAVNVDYMRAVADRIPGTSGAALEEATLGRARPDVPSRPDRSRYGIILLRMIGIVFTLPRELHALHAQIHPWWRRIVGEAAQADLPQAVALFDESCERYMRIIVLQGLIATLASAFWDPVARLVRRLAGEDELLQITAGYGNVLEARMLERLWDVSRARLSLDEFVAQYGYLAASAGELAHTSWREDRTALHAIVERYRSLPEDEHPARRQAAARSRFEAVRARLLAAAGPLDRLRLRIALRLAGRMLPVREVGKACMVMGTDAARATARRIGSLLAERGDIAAADDVFFLTRAQLQAAVTQPADRRPLLVAQRRVHSAFESLALPDFFTAEALTAILSGADVADVAGAEVAAPQAGDALLLRGIGVSRGCVSGIARVITDPNRVDGFAPGDILVCHITDPGWAALFSIAGGMVVDIGGMLSHSAIIARELGIPAVVNTRDGTRRIADGARIVVDGARGEVRLVEAENAP
jgi:rifampicin phosphotransferase